MTVVKQPRCSPGRASRWGLGLEGVDGPPSGGLPVAHRFQGLHGRQGLDRKGYVSAGGLWGW